MLHRSTFLAAAIVALCAAGAAYSQAAPAGPLAGAARATPNATAQLAGPGRRIVRPQSGVTVVFATTSLSCSNANGSTTTYTLSVDGGSCANGTITGPDGVTRPLGRAHCSNSSGGSTEASCGQGCKGSSGSGSCTQTTTPPS